MTRCFIALGSNLHVPIAQVTTAVEFLRQLPSCSFKAISPWYQSAPVGPSGQQDYINGVVEIRTSLSPIELLSELQAIEVKQHRVKTVHWGPRTIDLDILLFGDRLVNEERLTIPHPRMLERNFVLYPLFDIAPELILPNNISLRDIIKTCPRDGLHLVDQASSNTMRDNGESPDC